MRLLIAAVVDFLAFLALMSATYVVVAIYSFYAPSDTSNFVMKLASICIVVVPVLAAAFRPAIAALKGWKRRM